jgi:hypothetical protein
MWKPEFCFGDFLPPGAKKKFQKIWIIFFSVNLTNFCTKIGGK